MRYTMRVGEGESFRRRRGCVPHRRRSSRWLLPVMMMGPFLAGSLAEGQPQQKLISASYSDKTDSQGFRWDIRNYGQIGSGTNSSFDSAETLTVNGSSFRPTQGMMTADGSEYVLTARISNLEVTRRIKVDLSSCAVRYVEVLRNLGSTPVTATLALKTQLPRGPSQGLFTDTGTPAGASLGKKDSGLVVIGQSTNQQLSLLFHLAGARSKLKPTIQNQNNYRFTFTYSVSVPAGKTVSILHGIAQRRLAAMPNPKAAAALFKVFAARGWTRDLPRDIRRSIINLGGVGFGGFADVGSLVTLESLGVERQAADVLAVGEQTRLHGTASCKAFAVETRFGTLKLGLEKIAGIAGQRCTGGTPRVFLVDGQVLNGRITVEGLQFTMNSGLQLTLEAENLDRLVMRAGPDDGKPADSVVAMLETTDGDRLALLQGTASPAAGGTASLAAGGTASPAAGGTASLAAGGTASPAARGAEQKVAITTPWGDRQIALDEIERMFLSEQKVGHHLVLRDGSRLFGFVSGSALSLKTLFFGVREFTPSQIRRMTAVGRTSFEDSPAAEIAASHLLLVGDNVLVGQVDLALIHFITSGQKIPVPPNQIRLLRSIGGEGGDAAPLFEAELWDGGMISGALAEPVLPVRCGGVLAQVPLHDVLEVHVPTPVVADTMRSKIAQLIRDLGHPEYSKRKAAKESLAELGHLPKLQFSEALRQTSDPEVRRSVEALLAELQE